jgi:hypothetical protein
MSAENTGTHHEQSMQELQEQHRQYSEKLEGLTKASYLTADEQIEEVRLKKLKLRIKDEIFGHRTSYQFN